MVPKSLFVFELAGFFLHSRLSTLVDTLNTTDGMVLNHMSVLDLLAWFRRLRTPGPCLPDKEVREMSDQARSDTVTEDVLTNQFDRTNLPIFEYIEDDEQPEYVFRGNRLLISDREGALSREFPTRELQVIISDERLLFILGDRISDDLWEVPLTSILNTYLDDKSWRNYLVVEASREGNEMTFFAEVTIETRDEEIQLGINYMRERSN